MWCRLYRRHRREKFRIKAKKNQFFDIKNYIFSKFRRWASAPAKHVAPYATGRKAFCQQLIEYGIRKFFDGIFAEARHKSAANASGM